jgi:hypothetical protein
MGFEFIGERFDRVQADVADVRRLMIGLLEPFEAIEASIRRIETRMAVLESRMDAMVEPPGQAGGAASARAPADPAGRGQGGGRLRCPISSPGTHASRTDVPGDGNPTPRRHTRGAVSHERHSHGLARSASTSASRSPALTRPSTRLRNCVPKPRSSSAGDGSCWSQCSERCWPRWWRGCLRSCGPSVCHDGFAGFDANCNGPMIRLR